MRIRGNVAGSAFAALSSVALIAAVGATTATADPNPVAGCGPWRTSVVASGYNMLEGLAFDGRGGLLLSDQSASGTGGAIRRIDAAGARSTLATVDGPGAVLVSENTAYFVAGLSMPSVLAGQANGTINAIDLDTGAVSTTVSGLRAPNGIALLPNGDFVVTSDMGSDTRMSLVRNNVYAGPFAALTSTNGVAYDQSRRRLFVSTTFDPATTIAMFDIDRPGAAPTLFTLPGFGPLNGGDDLTVGSDGVVYVALSTGGRIVRLDPGTGASCTIADNLPLSTAVEFGSGQGWDPAALYATSYLGTVTKLNPTS
ncbi:SMP-30/gluconolactonase/LRE family protein [Nocardia altamirensis]|uniref:SMP-30/gluconolactonase/LRE family protein n=1 Tax=Nocardia altamirensis TaxID=472158 RepID=UPI0008404667|nr:SMP-30/gluconolactonase/LRE family protein [Nocardia altamirensis]